MKIQKGIVKYKDRNDIVCTYGVTDDGKQFYFLDETDEKKFANGNRVASTELVEAIDPMVKASHIGIVGANGNEVIPFIYKSIRPVNDSIVLVELAKPTSPSVLEAISLKSDPLSAAKLVSTPAAIKEKLNAKMGAEGRYLFNDQFSEVTVCDIDGNNLINNQLFSFAGLSNGKLYLSKNTVDSEIVEFSLLPPEEQVSDNVVDDSVSNNSINVTEVNVPENIVDKAIEGASNSTISEIPPIVTEDNDTNDSTVIDKPISNEENISSNDSIEVENEIPPVVADESDVIQNLPSENEDVQHIDDTVTETNNEFNDSDSNVQNVINESSDYQVDVDSSNSNVVDFSNDNNINEEVSAEPTNLNDNNFVESKSIDEESFDDELDFDSVDDDDDDENDSVAVSFSEPITSTLPSVEDSLSDSDVSGIPDIDFNDISETSENNDNINLDEKEDFNDDLFNDDSYKIDNVESNDYYNDSYSSYVSSSSDSSNSIINDVAKSLTSLMKQNRNQKVIISEYKDKLDKLSASRRNIVEKAKIQEQKLEVLNSKNRNFETTISKLEAKLQMLESRIRDQDKLIAYQSKELDSIKPKKDDLAKLVADAQALLGDDVNNSYPF